MEIEKKRPTINQWARAWCEERGIPPEFIPHAEKNQVGLNSVNREVNRALC